LLLLHHSSLAFFGVSRSKRNDLFNQPHHPQS